MAVVEQPVGENREELVAEILRGRRPRSFEEMLGPEPRPGDAEDLEEFLSFIHIHRRPVQVPDGEEQP